MNESEQGYRDGQKYVWEYLLVECIHHLSMEDDPFAQVVHLSQERRETIAVLRRLCVVLGDNDWPDELYIPDILEKHVLPYLED